MDPTGEMDPWDILDQSSWTHSISHSLLNTVVRLPSRDELPQVHEQLRSQGLCEDVSLLLVCWNPLQMEDAIGVLLSLHIRKEMVELDSNVFGSWSQLGIVCKLNTTSICLLYTSPSPRDGLLSRMPSSA